jgi:hypothetical protein
MIAKKFRDTPTNRCRIRYQKDTLSADPTRQWEHGKKSVLSFCIHLSPNFVENQFARSAEQAPSVQSRSKPDKSALSTQATKQQRK